MAGVRLDGWIGVFLVTTVLTNATGFGFPFRTLLPSHIVAGISLLVLPVAIAARYWKHLAGTWRQVFVVGRCWRSTSMSSSCWSSLSEDPGPDHRRSHPEGSGICGRPAHRPRAVRRPWKGGEGLPGRARGSGWLSDAGRARAALRVGGPNASINGRESDPTRLAHGSGQLHGPRRSHRSGSTLPISPGRAGRASRRQRGPAGAREVIYMNLLAPR